VQQRFLIIQLQLRFLSAKLCHGTAHCNHIATINPWVYWREGPWIYLAAALNQGRHNATEVLALVLGKTELKG